MLDVCLLGAGGVVPMVNRWLSALLLRFNGRMILIDCGEGTQIAVRQAPWGFKSIDAILFTHYHADHIAGLPGMLLALGNSGRDEPLTIAGPPGLMDVVKGLTVICPHLPYELKLVELSVTRENEMIINDMHVRTAPAEHTMPCLAYCVVIHRNARFDVERAKELNIPVVLWNKLQKGETAELYGREITPQMVLGEQRKGIKVCYCTDARPSEKIVEFIRDADLFICEGMYGREDETEKAMEKKHMTFAEAAQMAKQGEVGGLWLTHYSPSISDPEDYIQIARAAFKDTEAGKDILKKTIGFGY